MFCQNRSRRFYNNVPYIDVLPKSIANSNDNNNVPYIDVLPKSIAQTKPNNRRSIKLGRSPWGRAAGPGAKPLSWGEAPSETARDDETYKHQ